VPQSSYFLVLVWFFTRALLLLLRRLFVFRAILASLVFFAHKWKTASLSVQVPYSPHLERDLAGPARNKVAIIDCECSKAIWIDIWINKLPTHQILVRGHRLGLGMSSAHLNSFSLLAKFRQKEKLKIKNSKVK
jgi:hypothetical protein